MKKIVTPPKASIAKTLKAEKTKVSSGINKIEIDNHKKAAKHHQDAAKHHQDAVKHIEAGNLKQAKASKDKAHGILLFLHKLWEKIKK
jgi:hypothetical protein